MDPLTAPYTTDKTTPAPSVSSQGSVPIGTSPPPTGSSMGSKKSTGIGGTATTTGSQVSFSSTGTGVGFSSASSSSSAVSGSGAIETRVACVAIIGKQNNPIYIQTFRDESRYSSMSASPLDKLKYHYIIHTSLDAVEEKLSSGKPDQYIGFLFPTDEGKVYGYVTCTKIKFIVIIDDGATVGSGNGGAGVGSGSGASGSGAHQEVKESTIRSLFKKIHEEYTNIVSNPFYDPSQKMTSKEIDKKFKEICSGI